MNRPEKLYTSLENLNIPFEYIEHPAAHTVEEGLRYLSGVDALLCKNLFFRNHKGNRHYLVVLAFSSVLDIHALEKRLGQGKLSFASEQRMDKYLGVKPGSVTPFGLIHDTEHHVHVFLDKKLQHAARLCFHPLVNTATLVLSQTDFLRFMDSTHNVYEWVEVS
ncbi:MAG: prolyl-tRNA synthetase associated domain-containing protein [Bacteroidales bacterium]|nr:prolyl-tRNA synthetase associated domain-containing protein [Bacteroidales bacterium]